jgi:N-terminal domain of unknown function (DUF4140)
MTINQACFIARSSSKWRFILKLFELSCYTFCANKVNMRFRAASITSERSERVFQAVDDAFITQVTVFQNCAEVTRTLAVACADAGFCDIKLQGVPSIDPNSLHVKAQGKCALQRVSYSEVPDQTELVALPGQIVVSYNNDAHFGQSPFGVMGLSCAMTRRRTKQVLFPRAAAMISIFDFFFVRVELQVCLEVLQEGNVELELSYIVAGASWRSTYDVRADTTQQDALTCRYYGEVQQVRWQPFMNSQHFAML